MLLGLLLTFTTNVNASPSVMISSYTLTPSVLMPGDTATLKVTVYNAEITSTQTDQEIANDYISTTTQTSGATIKRIWITTVGDGDNDITPSSYYDDVGLIAPGASIPITFTVTADENITQGWYFPKAKVNLESSSHQDVTYPVTVRVSNATVELIDSKVPSAISVSGSTDITISVLNNFEASVDAVTITPINTNGVDFNPKTYFVGTMTPDEYKDIVFSVTPSTIGNINLSFNASFKNGNNVHTNNLSIPITIVKTPDVAPVLYNIPKTIAKGESERFRVEVYNAKTESISGVIVTPITDVRITPSQYFIGSMDPDDVFSASFDVYTDDLTIGNNYSIDFEVSFKQNENYYQTPTASSIFTIAKPIDTSGDRGITLYTVIIIFVVLIFIYFIYRYRKRRIVR
jgi:hypothetical protein